MKQIHHYSLFFISQNFYKQCQAEIGKKNQANAKQQSEAEFLLYEIIHIFHSRYHPKIMKHMLKNKQKNKCVCIHEIILIPAK